MRAQVETPIDPRSVPVLEGRAQNPREFEGALREEGRRQTQEQADEAVRRRARERGATQVPNAAPPDRATRRGQRLYPIFDPFSAAEQIGATIGEVAGEVVGENRYGQTEAEVAAAAAREKELAERRRAEGRPLPGEVAGEVRFEIPNKIDPRTGRRIPRAGEMQVFDPYPVWGPPQPAPPPPKRNRLQRALSRVQAVTSNRWAQLGVLGLGVLGSKRKRSARSTLQSQTVTPVTFPDVETVDAFTPADVPFSAAGFGGTFTPSRNVAGNCDCKPKRKGPKRRCLERAQVAWRTGRYKGKLAGTRCVRWE